MQQIRSLDTIIDGPEKTGNDQYEKLLYQEE